MKVFTLYTTYCIVILTVFEICKGDFNCRRKGYFCKNGARCERDGTCECPETHDGYDCSIEKSSLNCETNVCENDGLCYNDGKCFCAPDFYGEKCQYKTVTSECFGTEIKMNFVAPSTFNGEVYVSADEENCKFNKLESEAPGFDKYSLTIPFDASDDNACAKAVNETADSPMVGDTSRFVDVLISYNPMFISSTDNIIVFSCVHKGSNFTMFAELDDVGLNERKNLKKDIQAATYQPVKFVVIGEDNEPITKPLFVGDIFKLLFFLSDTNVYETLRIDYCVANNTNAEKIVQFVFIEDGCPTMDGKNILVNPDGPVASTYTRPETTDALPASELLMYAFKFKGTTNVGFNCAVKICKKGDESLCEPRQCSSSVPALDTTTRRPDVVPEMSTQTVLDTAVVANETEIETNTTGQVARRKRSSAERQFFSTVLTVQEPDLSEVLILPNQKQSIGSLPKAKTAGIGTSNRSQCTLSSDMIVVIVVMATAVFVLLLIACVLGIAVCRSKRREDLIKDRHSYDFPYSIPRPKLNEK